MGIEDGSRDPDWRLCFLNNWRSERKWKAKDMMGIITSLDLDTGCFEVYYLDDVARPNRAFVPWLAVKALTHAQEGCMKRKKKALVEAAKGWMRENSMLSS